MDENSHTDRHRRRPAHVNRTTAALAALAVLAAMLASCGSDGRDATASAAAPTTVSPAEAAPPVATSGRWADGFTSDEQLAWTVDLLTTGTAPAGEIGERFAPSFLATVPPEALLESLAELTGRYAVVEDDGGAEERSGVIERSSDGLRLAFSLAIDPDDGGRMIGLRFTPARPDVEGPAGSDDVDAAMAVAPRHAYALFSVDGAECRVLHQAGSSEPLAIASGMKLWVLLAIAEQVDAGTVSWSDPVAVTDRLRSTPDGEVSGRPEGDRLTVAELAELMISISDNTATDLLIDHVGRERVEDAMVNSGVAAPGSNIPFPTTREIFLLKLDPSHAGYVDLSPEQRRAYLDETVADQRLDGPGELDEADLPPAPWQIEDLEWFATPGDLCQAMARLAVFARDPVHADHLRVALGTNPGGRIDRDRWPTAWFKGGSEPGVISGTWYLVDADGEAYVATGMLNDPDNDFGEVAGVAALQLLVPLLESGPVPGT